MSRFAEVNAKAEAVPTVYVVEDDAAVRDALAFLMKSADLNCATFENAEDFLKTSNPEMCGCVVTDLRMPDVSGIELLKQLRAVGIDIPVIVMSAYGDIPRAVSAMRAGAFDFIEKPIDKRLLNLIQRAFNEDTGLRQRGHRVESAQERLSKLTAREKEVFTLVCQGLLNKQVASELGISVRTVENHRSRVMEKLGADSVADLVRIEIASTE